MRVAITLLTLLASTGATSAIDRGHLAVQNRTRGVDTLVTIEKMSCIGPQLRALDKQLIGPGQRRDVTGVDTVTGPQCNPQTTGYVLSFLTRDAARPGWAPGFEVANRMLLPLDKGMRVQCRPAKMSFGRASSGPQGTTIDSATYRVSCQYDARTGDALVTISDRPFGR
ncbi:MAG: hypothetical protein JST92_24175 [Deltaproteobacteria bacterium]|nr:hypothetical protein [Deltaproteobacteria bacterium]